MSRPGTGVTEDPSARRDRKKQRSSKDESDPTMRLESNTEHRTRPSTNGSSQNGSSPQTNGSAKTETNGFHTNGHSPSKNMTPFYGHDREEVTRILLQSLSDLGYQGAAAQLSRESGYELEIPSVANFRAAVQHGDWAEAESLLFGTEDQDNGVSLNVSSNGNGNSTWRKSMSSLGSNGGSNGLPLAEGADKTQLLFYMRQQKYLELLEQRDINGALMVLRNELTPLKKDISRIHALSSLMMCSSSEDLRTQAQWDGAQGESRSLLLSEISTFISPSVMIPEHRLATLFSAVQEEQILDCRYHNTTAQPSLYTDHACAAEDFPLQTLIELRNHTDEVWFVEFSHDGSMLATAGKDGAVMIYRTDRWSIMHEFREHDRNAGVSENNGVSFVAFSPDDKYIISCGQNNECVVVELRTSRRVFVADHFDYCVTTAAWLPDSQTFVVGGQGSRKPLGLYSLRSGSSSSSPTRNSEIHSWRDPPWDSTTNKDVSPSFRISDCAVSRDGSKMVATTLDNRIMLYDLRTKHKVNEWQMEDKLTSINFNSDGSQILVNMNEGHVLALDSSTGQTIMRYAGAKQAKYVIRSCFGGAGENFVLSGSEGDLLQPDSAALGVTDLRNRLTCLHLEKADWHTGCGARSAQSWHCQCGSMASDQPVHLCQRWR